MADPVVTATPYNPLLTYQFRIQLLDPPGDPTPEQLEATRTTLPGTNAGRVGAADIGAAPMGFVAGVRRVSGLTLTAAASETWEGGNSLHRYANPHRAVWEPILLEQGISTDTSLQDWAEAGVRFLRTGTVDPAQPVKRNVLLGVFTNAGDLVPRLRYVIFNAWVSKYQAIPRLDAMADEVALLSVELTHHGWRRDPPPDLFDTPD
ncbi:T4-like virus tail tube protein gp19 [Mycolicibacterium mageritense DSM 44476 = CIP 104973]|uniref:phage tail protein n=1 Tax=Mycolicibacterium mageritense TaxID=53462 RepID=UPI000433B158|nr:phage tail protein [Mycolicibacterium mageritense]CDO24327.1 T4-like virus tail tube protein gp19 [Mycolicibacterium mageritense DSM 44476 = CIP 104973]